MTEVEILDPPDVNQPAHLVSDVEFWKSQYMLLSCACLEHKKVISAVLDSVTDRHVYLATVHDTGEPGKEGRRFLREMGLYLRPLRHQMEQLRSDALEYLSLVASLRRYSDDPSLKLASLDVTCRHARESLYYHTKLVDDIKQDYHKCMFGIEKLKLREPESTNSHAAAVHRAQVRLTEKERRAAQLAQSYTARLQTWARKLEKLQKVSGDLESAYLVREECRAQTVLAVVDRSSETTSLPRHAKRKPKFTRINGRTLIEESAIKREIIPVPSFEEYVFNGAVVDVSPMSDRPEHPQDERTETCTDMATGEMVAVGGHRKQLVTRTYEKQAVNQISLKLGEQVKQLLPENIETGLAFGEVLHGLLRKKKRGFYPVSHVVDIEESGDSRSPDKDVTGEEIARRSRPYLSVGERGENRNSDLSRRFLNVVDSGEGRNSDCQRRCLSVEESEHGRSSDSSRPCLSLIHSEDSRSSDRGANDERISRRSRPYLSDNPRSPLLVDAGHATSTNKSGIAACGVKMNADTVMKGLNEGFKTPNHDSGDGAGDTNMKTNRNVTDNAEEDAQSATSSKRATKKTVFSSIFQKIRKTKRRVDDLEPVAAQSDVVEEDDARSMTSNMSERGSVVVDLFPDESDQEVTHPSNSNSSEQGSTVVELFLNESDQELKHAVEAVGVRPKPRAYQAVLEVPGMFVDHPDDWNGEMAC